MTNRSEGGSLPVYLVALGDVVSLNVGFVLAFLLRFGLAINPRNFDAYIRIIPVFSAFTVLSMFAFDLYRRRRITVRLALTSIGRPVFLTALFGASFVLFTSWFSLPRSIIFLGFLLGGGFVLAWRVALAKIDLSYRSRERLLVVIDEDALSDNDQRETVRRLSSEKAEDNELVAVLDHRQVRMILDSCAQVDVVVISAAVPEGSRATLTSTMLAMGVRIFLVPAAFDLALHTGRLSDYYSVDGIELSDGSLPPLAAALKRLSDIVASTVLLLLAAPVGVLAAVAIRLDDSGPVIFRQERVGKDRRPFVVLKFRTMHVDAESETGAVIASRNDPRVTRVGRFLRSSRVDELPQLWNVLKGEMSIVGPRPERPEFVDEFAGSVPAYDRRFVVRPGVTGLAQVRGRYASSPAEKLRFDLLYINQISFVFDLRIAVQTISTILDFRSARGAETMGDLPRRLHPMSNDAKTTDIDLRSDNLASTDKLTAPNETIGAAERGQS